MTSDGELLRRYTESNSEDAFAELVRRHLDLVYSAARQKNFV
jgi:DNA-directed RNA polymerase sigma subunit (sigma70/sigma32)